MRSLLVIGFGLAGCRWPSVCRPQPTRPLQLQPGRVGASHHSEAERHELFTVGVRNLFLCAFDVFACLIFVIFRRITILIFIVEIHEVLLEILKLQRVFSWRNPNCCPEHTNYQLCGFFSSTNQIEHLIAHKCMFIDVIYFLPIVFEWYS